ncbi:hypothetical protein FACS1894211_07090 [Clostridia bacterium]|nr:hypothetical protein FACS1894211_07090 [Clostridia bacterium]
MLRAKIEKKMDEMEIYLKDLQARQVQIELNGAGDLQPKNHQLCRFAD